MEKTVEQLLEMSKNPYYTLTNEEQKRLDDFLSVNSAPKSQAPSSGSTSERNIPATVLNKNKVNKETGQIPTVDNTPKKETGLIEDEEYQKISEDLAKRPAVINDQERATDAEAVEDIVHPDAVNDTPDAS